MTSVAPRRQNEMDLMNTEISFQVYADYLQVTLTGAYPVERELLETLRDEAQRVNRENILVNAFGLASPRTEIDRFWLGKTIADVFTHRFKIAALVRHEFISSAAENTAVNRGARFFVTSDEKTALRWLIE